MRKAKFILSFLKKLMFQTKVKSTIYVSEKKIENTIENSVIESDQWTSTESSLSRRMYTDYDDYLEHQRSKLSKIDLTNYDLKYRSALKERLSALNIFSRGDSVLCLGARIGTECKAFIDMGCFPIGIDLNPGEKNAYVVHGDFHNLQFADESIDYVFTNALDHVFDFEKVVSEVIRVLKPSGVLVAEIVAGTQDEHGRKPGLYESFWWDRSAVVIEKINAHGFLIERKERFTYPWGGDQIIFRKIT